jgi:glycosyltransferase involved in cell wall biosynthesis
LAQSLARLDVPATVVLFADHGANPWCIQLASAGVPVRILDNSFRSLLEALRRHRPHLLHAHGYKAGFLGRVAARLAGIPVVTTFHTGERGSFPVGFYDWLDEWTSFLGQRIAVSDAIRRRLPFSSAVIPSFVLTPETAVASPLPRRVGFVGRLSHEKGPDIFCEVARRAPAGIEWHVYGDGPMRNELEREFGSVVRFHGIATDMTPVWPSLGLLLMPSHFEGIPLAALEALAHGVPVLASHVGGMPTVVLEGETGWLFEPANTGAALARLETWRALDPAAQIAMRRLCWSHVRAHFSEARYLPAVLSVYRAGLASVGAAASSPIGLPP